MFFAALWATKLVVFTSPLGSDFWPDMNCMSYSAAIAMAVIAPGHYPPGHGPPGYGGYGPTPGYPVAPQPGWDPRFPPPR